MAAILNTVNNDGKGKKGQAVSATFTSRTDMPRGRTVIYFVDFEASSLLPGSYPIEVGWVDMDGIGESHLIRPTQEWLDRGTWSLESQEVHGISMEELMDMGIDVRTVAKRTFHVLLLQSASVFSDAPMHDGVWMDTLLAAGGIHHASRLLDVAQAMGMACRPLMALLTPGTARDALQARRLSTMALAIMAEAANQEERLPRTRHRALADAQGLWRTWMAISQAISEAVNAQTPSASKP
jgi:hypothetical protein